MTKDMSRNIINAGLASFGVSGQVFHAPFINAHPGIRLHTIVERHGHKSEALYPDAAVVHSFDELIADRHIDLVIVNTPNRLHYEMAFKALKAGKNVIIEKPFTLTSREARQLEEYARLHGQLLSIYQNRRWDGDFLTVKKIIENGWLGELVTYEAHFDRFRQEVKEDAWKESGEPGAGILYDLGPHLIDQALFLFGPPQGVTAAIRKQRQDSKSDDYFKIEMDYPKLKVTLSAGMLVREPGPHFILHGMNGSFVKYGMDPQEAALKQGCPPGGENWGKENPDKFGTLNTEMNGLAVRGKVETIAGSYMNYYDDICHAIMNRRMPAVTAADGIMVMEIIENALKSNQEQKSIIPIII